MEKRNASIVREPLKTRGIRVAKRFQQSIYIAPSVRNQHALKVKAAAVVHFRSFSMATSDVLKVTVQLTFRETYQSIFAIVAGARKPWQWAVSVLKNILFAAALFFVFCLLLAWQDEILCGPPHKISQIH